jgi:hypothetical protein
MWVGGDAAVCCPSRSNPSCPFALASVCVFSPSLHEAAKGQARPARPPLERETNRQEASAYPMA